MAKDIRIIPASGLIAFSGSNEQSTLTVADDGKIALQGSGSTIFDIQGSQGQLFSVTDSLVGSLFSVNDISGIPILEVFDTDKVVMGTFGQNTLVVTGSNVGIGTDSPNTPLMIETNTTDVLGALKIKNAGTGDASMFFTVNAAGTVWQLGIDNSDGDKFKIGQDNLNADVGVGTKLTIDTSGNVGIGTTDPAGRLDVQGSTTGDLLARVWNTNTSGTGDSILRIANSGNNANGNRIEFSDQNYYTATISGDRSQGIVFRTSATGTSATGIPERMRITSTGNVGIGTTTPYTKLVVGSRGTAAATSILAYDGIAFDFYNDDSPYKRHGVIISQAADASESVLDFNTKAASGTNSTKMTILGNGNVGIGTTSPLSKLDVHTNLSGYGAYGPNFPNLNLTNTDTTGESGFLMLSSYYNNGVNTYYKSGGIGGGKETTVGDGAWGGYLSFWTTSDGTAGAASGMFEHMRITADGNVGVGNTSPGAVFTVGEQSTGTSGAGVAQDNSIVSRVGAANAAGRVTGLTIANTATATVGNDATLSFIVAGNYSATSLISSILQSTGTAATDMAFSVYDTSGNFERMRIKANGNVGIGTTNPTVRLDYGNSLNQAFHLHTNGADTYGINMKQYDSQGYSTSIFSGNGGYIKFRTASGTTTQTTRMTVTPAGNVGIGTTAPTVALDVVGTIQAKSRVDIEDTDSTSIHGSIFSNGSEGVMRLSNGSNWGLLAKGPSNSPVIGAYDGGNLGIVGFSDANASTVSNRLATFNFAESEVEIRGRMLANQSNLYNSPTLSIASFGATTIDSSVSYYDTGKNVSTDIRGMVWTGKHYIITKYQAQEALFYDNNWDIIPGVSGSTAITLPNPSGGSDHPHGAAWDGRYLYCIVYSGPGAKIVGYDLDTGTSTADIVVTSDVLSISGDTYGIEYAEGHLYVVTDGRIHIYKLEGKLITHVRTTADILSSIEAQAITYDGSYLWITQNGQDIFKVNLDGTLEDTIQANIPPNNVGWAWNGENIATVNYSTGDIYIINTAFKRIDTETLALMGGNVGVGRTNPTARLHVYEATSADALLKITPSVGAADPILQFTAQGDNIGTEGFEIWYDNSVGDVHLATTYNDDAAAFRFHTRTAASKSTSNERLTIDGNGNVGIGATSPAHKLEVNGNALINNLYLGGNTLTRLSSNGSGEFGINYNSSATSTYGFTVYDGGTNRVFGVKRATGDVDIAGNLTVSGIVTAQEFHTEFVSASIIYQSGSTQFGNSADDTHDFTGRIDSAYDMFTGNTSGELEASKTILGNINFKGVASQSAGSTGTTQQGITWQINKYDGTIDYGNQAQLVVGSNGSVGTFMGLFTSDNYSNAPVERFRIQPNGNVGIGTDAPSRKLHVSAGNGDIAAKFENTSNNSTVLHLQTTGDGKSMYFQTDHIYVSSGAMHFGNDTGDIYLKPGASNGVGINTTTPTGLFNSYISATRQITHNGNGGDLSVISDNNSSPVFYVKGTGTADLVNVFDNTTEVFTILDGGNVGIGTTSPSEKLEVVGNIKTSGIVYVGSTASTALTPSANDWIDIAEMAYGEHHGKIALEWNSLFAPGSSHHGWFEIEVGTYYSSAFNYGQDTYIEVSKALAHNDFWLNAVRVVDYGSTVRVQVQVARAVTAGTFRSFVLNNNQGTVSTVTPAINNNAYTVLALANVGEIDGEHVQKAIGNHTRFSSDVAFDEKVGIGVTDPQAPLEVMGTSNSAADGNEIISVTNTTGGTKLLLGVQENTQGWIQAAEGGTLRPLTLNPAGGDVGIGTTNPTSTLHVYRNADVWHARFGSATGELRIGGQTSSGAVIQAYTPAGGVRDLYIQRDGGNVGIGTNAPSQKLQVNGNIYAYNGELRLIQGYGITWNNGDNYIRGTSGYSLQFTTYDGSAAQVEVMRLTGGAPASGGQRVGIGTSTPAAKLQVVGGADVVNIEGSGSTANTSIFSIDGNNGRLFEVSDDLSDSLFSVNTIAGLPVLEVFADNRVVAGAYNQNDFVISGSRVGIGTDAPEARLHVSGTTPQIFVGTMTGGSNNDGIYDEDHIVVGEGGSISIGAERRGDYAKQATTATGTTFRSRLNIWSDNEDHITFGGASTHMVSAWEEWKMWINNDSADAGTLHLYHTNAKTEFARFTGGTGAGWYNGGNFGFGTTNPSAKVDIYTLGAYTSNNALALRAGNSLDASGSNQILMSWNGGTQYRHAIKTRHNSGAGSGNAVDFYIWDQANDAAGTIGTLHTMTLDNGNVGIGTTNPGDKLVVNGSMRAGNNGYDSTPGGTAFSHTLAANSSTSRVVNFDGNGSNPSVWWTNANTRLGAIDGETEGLAFWTNDTGGTWNRNFYIEPGNTIFTGNVGVNQTNPSERLDVVGNIEVSGWVGGNTSQTRDKFRVWNDSNYTIGFKSGYTYGHLNDYAMSFQMNDDADRGFWWGDAGHSDAQGAMSLTTNGKLTVANSLSIGQGESITTVPGDTLFVEGGTRLYSVSTAPTLLTLHNYQSDINPNGTQGNFIDFKMTDDNATFTPQVRIGMLVQDTDGDGGIPSEGTGNFVVYTAEGTDSAGNGTLTQRLKVSDKGTLTLSAYGAGFLKTNASGVVSVDTSTYLTAEADTLATVTARGNTTTTDIEAGNWISVNKTGAATTSQEAGFRWEYNDNAQYYFYTDNGNDGHLRLQAAGLSGEDDNNPRLIIPRTDKNIYLGVSGGSIGIGTTTPTATLTVEGSGSTILDVQGSQGQLFSVTDSLVGSLFSVNDISGIPILEVFDTDKVVAGTFGQNTLVVTGSKVAVGFDDSPYARMTVAASNHQAFAVSRTGVNVPSLFIGNDGGSTPRIAANNADLQIGRDLSDTFTPYVTVQNGTGNVGINTTNPSTKLHINLGDGGINGVAGIKIGATVDYPSLELGTYGTYGGMVRSFGNDLHYFSGHWRTIGVAATENHSHYWYTSRVGSTDWSTVKMELDHNGNLGIGTTDPKTKLAVAGDAPNSTLTAGNAVLDVYGTAATSRTDDSSLDILRLHRNNDATPSKASTFAIGLSFHEDPGNNYPRTRADFKTTGRTTDDSDVALTVMSVVDTGRVGIGTTDPSAKLHIDGGHIKVTGTATDQYFLEGVRTGVGTTIRIYDNANTAYIDSYNNMRFRANQNGGSGGVFSFTGGNVGIGVTGPSQALHVAGRITSDQRKFCTASISNSYVKIYEAIEASSQLATSVRISGVTHGSSHVSNFTADILVNHSQDVFIKSTSGAYTQVTLKVESNANGDYHLSIKSGSPNASTYYFTIEALSSEVTIVTNPTTTPNTTITHEHATNFGTNETGTGGTLSHRFAGTVIANQFTVDNEYTLPNADGSAGQAIVTDGAGNLSFSTVSGGSSTASSLDVTNTTSGTGYRVLFIDSAGTTGETVYVHDNGFEYDPGIKTLKLGGDVIAYFAFSDARLKTEVKPLTGALDSVMKLDGKTYQWKDNPERGTEIGLIAQEVEEVLPELVREKDRMDEGTFKSVDYEKITAVLIEAMKEQQTQIDELKEEIKKLKG